jgi:hypothetical protein
MGVASNAVGTPDHRLAAQLDMRKRFRGNHLSANKKASADPVSDVVSL